MKAKKPYVMVDLGYDRTPTSAVFEITFSNGERYAVPVQVVVDSRDRCYASDREDTVKFIRDGSLELSDLATDWAINNMNWSDLKEYATPLPPPPPKKIDHENEWLGPADIVWPEKI